MRWATITAAVGIMGCGVIALGATAEAYAAQAAPAAAPPAGGLFSSHGPVDIGADGMQQFQGDGRIIYTGNVDVVQGTARMKAPLMTVYTAKRQGGPKPATAPAGDMGSIERIEVEGPLYYVTPTQQVKGDHGTYIAANDTITVTGDVTLLQGQDVLHGNKLVIEQKTGVSTLTTDRPGKGPQRVRGVFFPKESNTTGASAPGPAAPAAKPGA